MRPNTIRFTAVLVLVAGLLCPLPRADEPEPRPMAKQKVDEKLQEKIKELVAQLGHDDFSVREEATKKLAEIGRPAVPAVREAAKSNDAEVRMRARRILDKIETSVT